MKIDEKLISYWGEDSFTNPNQVKRINSSLTAKMTPIYIDSDNLSCSFQGSGKKPYQTTIDSCDCRDWFVHKRPCKHMYRTAIELGYITELNVNNDISVVNEQHVINTGYSLSEAVDFVETLENEHQITLYYCLSQLSKENNPFSMNNNSSIQYLINKNVLIQKKDLSVLLWSYKKREINERISPLGLIYKKTMKFELLVNWCIENIDENQLLELFSDHVVILFNSKFVKARTNLYRYLHRKFGTLGDIPLLNTELPNDAPTKELIRHGYYSIDDYLDY